MKSFWQALHQQSRGLLFAHGYLSTATALEATQTAPLAELHAGSQKTPQDKNAKPMVSARCAHQ